MSRSLFFHIQSKVKTYEPYFIQKRDNAQKLDFILTTLPTYQYILLFYFEGDFG